MTTTRYGGIVSPDRLEMGRSSGLTDDSIADEMAKASPTFASQLSNIRKKFGGDPAATSAFLNTRFYGETNYTPAPAPEDKPKGYVGRTLDRIYQRADEFVGEGGIMDKYNQGQITSGQAVVRGAGKIFQGAVAPVTQATSDIVGAGLRATGGDKALQYLGNEFANSKLGQQVIPMAKGALDSYNALPESSGFRDLSSIAQSGVDALDVLGAGAVYNKTGSALKGAATAARHPVQTVKGFRKPVNDVALTGELTGKSREAVKTGLDENLVRFIGERNPDERYLMKAMTQEADSGTRILGGSTKAKEIVGNQILRNAEHVIETKKHVGKALGSITESMANEAVDVTNVANSLLDDMANKGVLFSRDTGKIRSIAAAADDEIPVLQKIVDFLQPDDQGRVVRSFVELDDFRKKVFQELGMAKAKLSPTSGGQSAFNFSDRIADAARSGLLREMSALNPNYGKLATAYAELSGGPSDFFKAIGFKGNLDDISTQSLRAGEVSMRTLGNASARPTEAIEKLLTISRKYGYSSPIDEMKLIRYADELENIFPIAPTRSLRGEIARSGEDVVGQVIKKKGLAMGTLAVADEKAMKVYDWVRGMTPENRIKLLYDLLDAPPERSFLSVARESLPENALSGVPNLKVEDARIPVAVGAFDASQSGGPAQPILPTGLGQ